MNEYRKRLSDRYPRTDVFHYRLNCRLPIHVDDVEDCMDDAHRYAALITSKQNRLLAACSAFVEP